MTAEDAATVLEDFIIDVANLPAEISHYLEEIQAKDQIIQECRSIIRNLDGNIQKHIKLNGSHVPHPKEEQYNKIILANYEKAQELQTAKIALTDKAALLLDRHTKRLDQKIRDLQREGTLSRDPPLPSLLHASPANLVSSSLSTHPSTGTSTPVASSMLSSALGNPALNRLLQQPSISQRSASHPLSTAHNASTPTPTHHQTLHITNRHRESSATPVSDASTGTNTKRRRLNTALQLPPSGLTRTSSLGPATPKPGTPAGSIRGGSAGPRSSTIAAATTKKTAASKRLAPHHAAIRKLKGTKSTSSGSSRKRKGTPAGDLSIDEDDDSILSEVASDTSVPLSHSHLHSHYQGGVVGGGSNSRHRRASTQDEMEDAGDEDAEGEGEDDAEGDEDKKYCTCRSVSYGNMVACDNPACPYEWFHWNCVGMTKEPQGKWFCPECRKN